MQSYEKTLKYIYSRELFGIKLGLSNISELMDKLDNPQDDFKTMKSIIKQLLSKNP